MRLFVETFSSSILFKKFILKIEFSSFLIIKINEFQVVVVID